MPSKADIRNGVAVVLRHLRREGLGEDALDLAQEAVATALDKIEKIPADVGWVPWLVGIAKNKVAEYKRRETRRTNRHDAVARCVSTESRTPQLDARHDIQKIVAQLTDLEHEALVHSFVLGMTGPEAAVALGISAESFAKRLDAARARIRNFLARDPRHATG